MDTYFLPVVPEDGAMPIVSFAGASDGEMLPLLGKAGPITDALLRYAGPVAA